MQRNSPTKSRLPGELAAQTRSRGQLDAQLLRRIDAALNLRLSLQNLLDGDSRRTAEARSGADVWQLGSHETGQRTWPLALEGKW